MQIFGQGKWKIVVENMVRLPNAQLRLPRGQAVRRRGRVQRDEPEAAFRPRHRDHGARSGLAGAAAHPERDA